MIKAKKCLLICASFIFVACGKSEEEYIDEIHGKWYGVAYESTDIEVEDYGSLNVGTKSIKLEYDDFRCTGNLEFDYVEDGIVYYSVYDVDDEYIGDLTYDPDYEYLIYNFDDTEIYYSRNADGVDVLEEAGILIESSKRNDEKENEESEKENEAETEENADDIVERNDTVVRNVRWGDNKETVKQFESLELMDEDDESLYYETSLNGAECYLIYYFENDELYRVGYMVKDIYSSGQYINFLSSFENSLEEKYGSPEPDSGIVKFENDSLIESAGEASALEFGYTAYKYEWITDDTKILLGATSADFEVSLLLGYQDINYEGPDEGF